MTKEVTAHERLKKTSDYNGLAGVQLSHGAAQILLAEHAALIAERDALRKALHEIACGTNVWERGDMIDCVADALNHATGGRE